MTLENYYNSKKKHDYMDKASFDPIIDSYFQSLQLNDKTIIEIGSGQGRYTSSLANYSKRVIASEPNSYFFNELQHNFSDTGNVEVLNKNIAQLTNTTFNQKVDYICLVHVLHHLPQECFNDLLELSKQTNAPLIIIEPNHINILFLIQLVLNKDMTWKEEKGMFKNNSKTLANLDAKSGFKRFYIGLFPRGLSVLLAKTIPILSNFRTFKTKLSNPFSAYSILELYP